MSEQNNIKTWCYDFEVYSKVPNGGWWCVTFIEYQSFIDWWLNKSEQKPIVVTVVNDPAKLRDFYNQYKDNVFAGYNSRAYDQFLYKGIMNGGKAPEINDKLIDGGRGFQIIGKANSIPLQNYDCILQDKSLKQLEGFMGDMIKETDVDFDIDRELTEEEIQQIIDYNIHDVEETCKVLYYTHGDFEAIVTMIEMFDLDKKMFNKTKAQLTSYVLGAVHNHTLDDEFEITIPANLRMPKEYQYIVDWFTNPMNKAYKLPLKDDSHQDNRQLHTIVANVPHDYGYGGIHGCDNNIVVEGILLIADVGSEYPSLMINENYYSRKLKEPKKFKVIRDRRLELKAKKDKRQQPLKICINGAYGVLKDPHSDCYDPLMSNNVCISGQLYMTELIAKLGAVVGVSILQSNTDGVYMKLDSMDILDKVKPILDEWQQRTKLELEVDVFEHGKLIQKDVNNYILIDMNDKSHYKSKGAYVKKLSPIDNDLPIINKALIEYFVNDVPVETTINECNDLIQFQKIIKLSSSYRKVLYGNGEVVKITNGKKVKNKIVVKNGIPLREKVHRVFASTRPTDKGLYKMRMEKGEETFEKISYTPDRCFINNDDIHDSPIPEYLDRQYYIDMAKDRIKQFLVPEPVVEDKVPDILFDCMQKSGTFYEFMKNVKNNPIQNITDNMLKPYIEANCCEQYGKSKRLLAFVDYFKLFYQKEKFNISWLEKNVTNQTLKDKIISLSELSKTGKTYTSFNYEVFLKWLFDRIPNEHIDIHRILEAQILKFQECRYVNQSLSKDLYFVLNVRNVIAPNIIIYSIATGEYKYVKVDKRIFNILPLYGGDLIQVKSWGKKFGEKIVGKDDKGINIIEENKEKVYDVIMSYDINYRNTKYKNIASEESYFSSDY